jgi:hypothetical protein
LIENLKASAVRHGDIEKHEIGSELANEFQRFTSLAGFTDYHHSFNLFDEYPNSSANQRVVIGD